MKNVEKSMLLDGLRRTLIPELMRHGFELVPLSGDDARSTEIRRSFPFGRLRRKADYGYEQVELQLDKYGKAAFRLNAGIIPFDGITYRVCHIMPEEVWVHYLESYFAVYQTPSIRRWFRPSRWPWERLDEVNVDKLLEAVVGMLPEIDRALRDGCCGRHIKRIGAQKRGSP